MADSAAMDPGEREDRPVTGRLRITVGPVRADASTTIASVSTPRRPSASRVNNPDRVIADHAHERGAQPEPRSTAAMIPPEQQIVSSAPSTSRSTWGGCQTTRHR